MPDSVKLEPVDEDSSRQSLIDLVIADVPPRYKAEVEKELRDRVK
jgi:hypothetical protein